MPDVLRILLLEDDPDTSALIAEVLSDHFDFADIVRAVTVAEAAAMDMHSFSIVLSDMNLPDGKGLDFLRQALTQRPDLPVVMVTTENVKDTAVSALQLGAYDYIVKAGDYLFSIPLVVEKTMRLWEAKQENNRLERELMTTLRELEHKNEQLETIAATDPLTGLANRRAFNHELERHFADANRHGRDVSLVMIDLDGFKQLNDTCGHPVGDRILERTARVLESNCRRYDIASRFGGDEFALLLPDTDLTTAVEVSRRVLDEFNVMAGNEARAIGYEGRVSISAGVATRMTGQLPTPEALLAAADETLYAAKRAGKGRIMTFHPAEAAPDAARPG